MRVVQNRFWPGGSNRTASNSTSNSHLPQQERVRHHFLIRTGNVDYNVVRYCTSFRYQRYQTIISGRGPTSRSYTKQSFPSWPAVLPEPKQKQPFQLPATWFCNGDIMSLKFETAFTWLTSFIFSKPTSDQICTYIGHLFSPGGGRPTPLGFKNDCLYIFSMFTSPPELQSFGIIL